MVSGLDLDDLISNPREAMDIECKDWLNLLDNDAKAGLAKEIIALANHGGGYILCGFTENDDGQFLPSSSRPKSLAQWSQDAIQDLIKRYVDPPIQCRTIFQAADAEGAQHPIIIVPGGHRSPVRAKAASPNGKKLVANRIYIRRPGPSSEEPQSAREWDDLLERCLQNRKDTLLSAMRAIMEGIIPTSEESGPSRKDDLMNFATESIHIWQDLVGTLPPDAGACLPLGYYEFGFAIDGNFDKPSLVELRRIIEREVKNHSGWPPFLTLESRSPFVMRIQAGAVQFWKGPDEDGRSDIPGRSDFWRISPDGFFFTRCGYREDTNPDPALNGKQFSVVIPTWRLGEAILDGFIHRKGDQRS